jgi:peroxin-11B
MSQALVAHLILHPKISQSLKVLATTVGRDKVRPHPLLPEGPVGLHMSLEADLGRLHASLLQVYRLVQYVSRLIAWYILRSGGPMAKETAMRWDGLKAGLASGRKSKFELPSRASML